MEKPDFPVVICFAPLLHPSTTDNRQKKQTTPRIIPFLEYILKGAPYIIEEMKRGRDYNTRVWQDSPQVGAAPHSSLISY
jgi:hypothetical protein